MKPLRFELYGDLLPVPYLRKGRTLAGLDCVGVFLEIQHRLGRTLPAYESDPEILESYLGEWARVETPEPGDAILIYSYDPAWHVGTVISLNSFIHGKDGVGVVVERYDRPEFSRRIEGFYRWKLQASDQSR